MGIKFGEIDAGQILDNEFRVGVLENLLQAILNRNQNLNLPSKEDVDQIRRNVMEGLKKKYPNSGIGLKGGK